MHIVAQVAASVWLLVTLWIGGLNLLVLAITHTVGRKVADPAVKKLWPNLSVYVVLVASGFLAFAWAFDPAQVKWVLIETGVSIGMLVLWLASADIVVRVIAPLIRGTPVAKWMH